MDASLIANSLLAPPILFFLMGAMTIVELVDAHEGFAIVTKRIRTRNKPTLLWTVGILTFFMSAALDNLTTTIVMTSLLRKLVADREFVGRKLPEDTARLDAHADLEWPATGRRTDAVGSAQLLAFALDLNRQVLTRQESVFVSQLVGHVERDANGVTALGRFCADCQRVKILHCRFAAEAAPTDI